MLFLGINSNINLPRRSTLTPSFPARRKFGMAALIDSAVSGPNIVYCGKPRRGIPPIDEKDRVDTSLLLIDVCAYDMLVVLLFAIVEVAARKKVDEARVDDDDVDTASRRKALDIVDIIDTNDLNGKEVKERSWVEIFVNKSPK